MKKKYTEYIWFALMILLMLLGLLTSCKTKQVTVKEDIRKDLIDTTKTVIDTISHRIEDIDTTKIQTISNDSVSIELDAGTIEINKDGSIIINKVKSIKGSKNTIQNILNGKSSVEQTDSVHREEKKGITDKTKSKVITKTEVWNALTKIITTVVLFLFGLFFIGLVIRFICRLW